MNRPGKHAETIILTGFELEFVLSSVHTVILIEHSPDIYRDSVPFISVPLKNKTQKELSREIKKYK